MLFVAHGSPGIKARVETPELHANPLAHANTLAGDVKGYSKYFFRRPKSPAGHYGFAGSLPIGYGPLSASTISVLPTPSDFDRLCVVLVSTRNPLNIGAAARAMSNMGFSRLRVVNPYEASFREARSAVGAAPLLAQAEQYGSVAEAVADCSLVVGTTAAGNRELQQPLKLLGEGAQLIRKRLRAGSRVALLFGSEKRGLSNDDLSHCHWLMHIPTRKEHVSMNLGQAVAVCLYELARAAGASRSHGPEKATARRGRDKAGIKKDKL